MSAGAEGSSDGAWVRAIGHVVDFGTGWAGDGDGCVDGDRAAVRRGDRGVDGWVEAVVAELVEDDGSALGEVAEEVVAGVLPGEPGFWDGVFGVAPACAFGDDGGVDDGGECVDAIEPCLGCEGTAVEEVSVCAVGPAHAVFGISGQILVEEHGIGVGEVGFVGAGEGSGTVFVDVEEGVLEVVDVEAEALAGVVVAAAGCGPVVGAVVAEEGGGGTVEVSGPEGGHEVVDEVVGIEEDGVCGGGDAIGGESLHAEVVLVGGVGAMGFGEVPEGVPGVDVSFDCLGGVVGVLLGLNDVVFFLGSAVVGGGEVGFGAFVEVEEAPVLAVDVEVDVADV